MSNTSTAVKVKSYWLNQFGIENLAVKESEQESLKTGQVRVKIHAASLNYRDLLMIKGQYDARVLLKGGLIPLSDCAGEVVEIAPDVVNLKTGDRVAAIFMQKWLAGDCTHEMNASALGGAIDGVLTTYKIFDQNGLVHLPKHYTYEEGATLPCAAVTAWHALIHSGKLKAGETVLLQGTGGVSIFGLQFAKITGATTIITSSDDNKLAKAKSLGADFVINYTKDPDWETTVRKITNNIGVDHIIEVGGANTLNKSLKSARMGGKIALIGILSGTGSSISLLPVLMKNITIQGIYVGSKEMFEAMNKAITATALQPIITKIFPFNETKQALHYLESGQHFGKIVIKIE